MALLTQIESLSHILAWTAPVADAHTAHALATAELVPVLVELPRLQIRFIVEHDERAGFTLWVADRAGTSVLPCRNDILLTP